ncbi:MAG: phosphodiester glycosidase family protein [Nitrospinae bacterium]|nr:phosphodiester glycosidase family protein [Nitrospinota bacterium]MBL7019691.1 phosphodiester glycosidase family protein [Nitrospinaceae bacterium]
MKRFQHLLIPFIVLLGILTLAISPGTRSTDPAVPSTWRNLEKGLDLGIFQAPKKSALGDSLIRILRADTDYFGLRLLNASSQDQGKRQSVKNWADRNDLVAAINASMYQKDMMSSVSYMKTRQHTNSNWVSKDKTILAFDPADKSLPPVRMIDRDCEDFDKLRKLYGTLIQSIRMVSCHGENMWAPHKRMWSTAAVGLDNRDRVLFIHVRSPYTSHDLINMLLELPLDLKQAMYVEGGADAQLYINTGKEKHEFIGSYSSGSREHDENTFSHSVPNVLGLVRLEK